MLFFSWDEKRRDKWVEKSKINYSTSPNSTTYLHLSSAWERHKYTRDINNAWEPWTMSLSEQWHLCTSSQAPLLLLEKAGIPLTQYSNQTSQLFVWAPQNHLHNPLQDPQANPWHRSVIVQHRNQLHFWREGWKKWLCRPTANCWGCPLALTRLQSRKCLSAQFSIMFSSQFTTDSV